MFLGVGTFAKECKIANPWVVDFQEMDGRFFATAPVAIEIENKALAYKMFYDLKKFEVSNGAFSILGSIRYEEIKPKNEKDKLNIIANRDKAFIGSERHFLQCLANKKLKDGGYLVFEVNPKFVSNGNVSKLNTQIGNRLFEFDESVFVEESQTPNTRLVSISNELEIINTNETVFENTYPDAPHPVSWLQFRKLNVLCKTDGILVNPTDIVWAGNIAQQRIANALPLDYIPKNIGQNQLQTLAKNLEKEQKKADMAVLYHRFANDSLEVKLKFNPEFDYSGKFNVSVVESQDEDFKPTAKVPKPAVAPNGEISYVEMPVGVNDTTDPKYTDPSSKQLKEVVIKEKKVKAKESSTLIARADVVLESKDLNLATGDVLSNIRGRIPGVTISESIDNAGGTTYKIDIRGSRTSSIQNYQPPAILLNGVFFSQDPLDLRTIPMAEVDKIEVFKRANAIFGQQGAGGVINITTKSQVAAVGNGSKKNDNYFYYKPNQTFQSKQDFSIKFWMPERGKKLVIIILGQTNEGDEIFLERNVISE
jgi:TonB-dependent Receptor Plug Domain